MFLIGVPQAWHFTCSFIYTKPCRAFLPCFLNQIVIFCCFLNVRGYVTEILMCQNIVAVKVEVAQMSTLGHCNHVKDCVLRKHVWSSSPEGCSAWSSSLVQVAFSARWKQCHLIYCSTITTVLCQNTKAGWVTMSELYHTKDVVNMLTKFQQKDMARPKSKSKRV